MLFRRQNDQTTTVNTQENKTPDNKTQAASSNTAKPLTATRPNDNSPVRQAPLTATPTAPISQAQQRRVITTPAGNYSMPSPNTATAGNRKLQVGRDITLQGEIGACDHLVIEGTVTATIKQLQQFDILDHGRFSGSVIADNADINGTFEGDITVAGRLWLRSNANVTGTLRYGSLQVEKGAIVRGTVDTLDNASPAKNTATFAANANDSSDA